MRDKRPVDDLSIEELERILAIRRREERQNRLKRMQQTGRVVSTDAKEPNGKPPEAPAPKPAASPPPAASNGAMSIPAATITLDALDAVLGQKEPPPRFDDETETDAPVVAVQPETAKVAEAAWRKFLNRTSLVIEIGAFIGLVAIGLIMLQAITTLETETREAQELANQQRLAVIPTPEPTSLISFVNLEQFVLPGGHTIDDTGVVQFNFDEFIEDVPAHLTTSVINHAMSVTIERPQRTPEMAKQLYIEKLGIDQTIIQGTDWEALKLGVGQALNGARPGDPAGNVVLAAHNDIYGALFASIPQLEPGDRFQLQTETETYTYVVTGSEEVDPTDIHVMQDRGRPTVTLITCHPPGINNKRYIVYADRVDSATF